MANLLRLRATTLLQTGQLLAALSYRGVLARGFALVRDGDGQPLRSAAAVSAGLRVQIEFADGRVGATTDGSRTAPLSPAPPPAPPRRRGGGGTPPGQGSLF
jgi:exodeoxyribonuclease VII large subunit